MILYFEFVSYFDIRISKFSRAGALSFQGGHKGRPYEHAVLIMEGDIFIETRREIYYNNSLM